MSRGKNEKNKYFLKNQYCPAISQYRNVANKNFRKKAGLKFFTLTSFSDAETAGSGTFSQTSVFRSSRTSSSVMGRGFNFMLALRQFFTMKSKCDSFNPYSEKSAPDLQSTAKLQGTVQKILRCRAETALPGNRRIFLAAARQIPCDNRRDQGCTRFSMRHMKQRTDRMGEPVDRSQPRLRKRHRRKQASFAHAGTVVKNRRIPGRRSGGFP